MSMDWVPFYNVGDRAACCLTSLECFNLSAANPLFEPLSKIICVGNAKAATTFSNATMKNIVIPKIEKFAVRELELDFPVYDEDRDMGFYPTMSFGIIGTEEGILSSTKELPKLAEKSRPFFEDNNFWIGDLDLEAIHFEERAKRLKRTSGVPVGMVSTNHFAFVVTDKSVEQKLIDVLSQKLRAAPGPSF